MDSKVKQARVGPTFVSSAKDVVAACNCCVHNNKSKVVIVRLFKI